jgi:hypothetical protein
MIVAPVKATGVSCAEAGSVAIPITSKAGQTELRNFKPLGFFPVAAWGYANPELLAPNRGRRIVGDSCVASRIADHSPR